MNHRKQKIGLIALGVIMVFVCVYTIHYQGENRIPAYAVAYLHDGQIEFSGTGEVQELTTACFEAGSISKTVTAYLCLKLVEEGKLSLDDAIIDYLDAPWITGDSRFSRITIKDLLSHRAGFSPSFEFGVDKKIYFEPGSRFSYSGVGYIYLQKVIEKASGMGLEQATAHYVFEPLKMDSSTFGSRKTITPYLSTSSFVLYTAIPWMFSSIVLFLLSILLRRKVKKSLRFYGSVTLGFLVTFLLLAAILPRMLLPFMIMGIGVFVLLFLCGKLQAFRYVGAIVGMLVFVVWGLVSQTVLPLGPAWVSKTPNAAYSLITNTRDMSLFMEALLEDYQKQEKPMQEMYTQWIEMDNGNGWGAGLGIERENQRTCYWHSGINPGMQSLLVLEPERRAGMLILTNSDYGLEFAKAEINRVLGIQGDFSTH